MTISDALQFYKKNIDKYWKQENYKWEAVKHFQSEWNIDADDFAKMLEASFSLADTLLNGSMYYPKRMICRLAQMNSEKVRALFKTIFDESIALAERIAEFKKGCDSLLNEYQRIDEEHAKTKNAYQDLRAISVYLTFMYPEKYFMYKYQMYEDFKKAIGYREKSQERDSEVRKYDNYAGLCREIIDEAKKDPELLQMQHERVSNDDKAYEDPELHILAQTVMFVYPKTENFDEFGPSREEYPVNLSKDDWKRFLEQIEMPGHRGSMRVLKGYVDIGGVASAKKMAEVYKGTASVYVGSIANMCRRALKYFNMQPWIDENDNNSKWGFPIAFQYKKESGQIVYKMRSELMEAVKEMDLSSIELEYKKGAEQMEDVQFDKNMILYGPPGTGKTYNTAIYAVAICDNKPLASLTDYEAVMERYNELKEEGRVAFTTFHQSYGYEEFIEGIKPKMGNGSDNIEYEIKDGCFKAFCNKAQETSVVKKMQMYLNEAPRVWKVSLKGTGENEVRRECLTNGHIRIGWDSYGPDLCAETKYTEGGKSILEAYTNKMQIGDIVFSCFSDTSIDAIGVVTGDVEWADYNQYRRLRKVEWIIKDIEIDILKINKGKHLVQGSVYELNIKKSEVEQLVESISAEQNNQAYVFIIDEINRGNISKIFGELITLIETTKRKGEAEEMEALLPYSNEAFGVPSNVYILGTMNTADRSIALMDTALRRRFRFIEMMPKADVLRNIGSDKVEDLDVAAMLDKINERITFLYDREHTIGHAFFTELREEPTVEKLASVFKKSIIPLLQEYFFEDYRKIQLILGDNAKSDDRYKFVKDVPVVAREIFKGSIDDVVDLPEKKYEINEEAFMELQSYKEII